MDEVKRYAIFVGHTFKDGVMDVMDLVQHGSSWPVKIYFFLLHVLLLSLVCYMFLYSKKGKYSKNLHRKGTRTFKRGNRAVTSESCQWVNSTIAWFYIHSGIKNTPDLVKMWIRNMNRALYQKRTNNRRIFITNICPNCLPPKLTSVYCLTVDGTMKCITFHVESSDLGFHVHVSQPTSNGRSKNVILEVNVLKLSGEVALQLNNSPFEVKISFIGEPEIQFSTRAITKDGVDAEAVDAVEEKLKEVICKTVTTVPLTDNNKPDNDTQNNGSLKDKLDSPILQTCVGEEGKLLVKVIKATGLCSKDQTAKMSPYCIITTDQPYQRKRTSLMKETESPFWNEYFAFDIGSKTREITLNIFDFEKTPSDANYHMDDNELSAEKDDFLGQAIVPLATVNRNQTCRLILPILPKTNKCDYVKGELSLEFTFDKDGKVIDGALPLVDITDSSAKPTAVEHTVYDVTIDKTQAVPAVNEDLPEKRTYGAAYAYSLDKSYMETSLDELAQEIEAYEAGTSHVSASEEKSVEIVMKAKETDQREHDDTELMLEVAALDATLCEPSGRKKSPVVAPTPSTEKGEDKEDNKPPKVDKEEEQQVEPKDEPKEEESKEESKEEQKEVQKEEPKEETKEEKSKSKTKKSLFKRRPKSTVDGDKKTGKDADTSRHSYHAGDQPLDETTETKENEPKPDEELGTELNREPKSKIRRSFNMKFKRGKKDKDKESSSSTHEIDAPKDEPHDEKKEQEDVEESLKSDPPKSRFKSRFRKDKDKESSSTTQEADTPKEEPNEEKKEEEVAEENVKTDVPKSRFRSRFRKDKDKQPSSKTEETDTPKEEPNEEKKDEEAVEENAKTDAPKSRFMSRFKRDKESAAQETDTPKEEEQEADLKSGPSKSRFSGRFKRKKQQDKQQDEKKDETKDEEKEKDEKKDEEPKQEEPKEEVVKPIEVELKQQEPNLEDIFKVESKQEETKDEERKPEEPKEDETKNEPKEEPIEEEPQKEEPIREETKKEEPKQKEHEKKELETVDENTESSPSEKPADQPKSRFRRLNLKRGNKRPVSMSAADIKPAESIEEETKVDPVTHSYHAGDLPETSQLQKSTSQSSLLSYSPNPFSSLVIEVRDKGEKKYYHIPVSMAKRGTYEQKGDKYHVYNDHMFKAVHFDESTNCAVCGNSISGKFGKQGYQCKGCKLATHKKCHFQTSDMCSENAAKKIDIKTAPTIVGN